LDAPEVTTLTIGTHPSWSPDTKRMAYATARVAEDAYAIVVREDDGRTWPLVESTGFELACPSFSADGASIVYVRRMRTPAQSEVWIAPARPGGSGAPIVQGEALGCPSWAPDGTLYVLASSDAMTRSKMLFHVRIAP
jgi:Tol biopolymer transport system component